MSGPENLLASFGRGVLIVFNSLKPSPVFELARGGVFFKTRTTGPRHHCIKMLKRYLRPHS